jgi:uncharacterized membrane protein YcjF (UPF0283 family)
VRLTLSGIADRFVFFLPTTDDSNYTTDETTQTEQIHSDDQTLHKPTTDDSNYTIDETTQTEQIHSDVVFVLFTLAVVLSSSRWLLFLSSSRWLLYCPLHVGCCIVFFTLAVVFVLFTLSVVLSVF